MAENSPVEIAIAVVERGGRFLIGLRPEGVALAGYWEFPGGKVEAGETSQAAAARECLEETGIEVTIGDAYPEVVHTYDHGKLRLHFFRATPKDPLMQPSPRFQWVPQASLAEYQFPEANQGLLTLLTETADRNAPDLRRWLAPAQLLIALLFAGLLVNCEGRPSRSDAPFIALVGIVLLILPVVNHVLSRGTGYQLRHAWFDLTAVAVTAIFARFVGGLFWLVWIPLLLLRRL